MGKTHCNLTAFQAQSFALIFSEIPLIAGSHKQHCRYAQAPSGTFIQPPGEKGDEVLMHFCMNVDQMWTPQTQVKEFM